MDNWFAGFWKGIPFFRGRWRVSVEPVGAGLCPRPVFGGRWRFCRGRPACRPVDGSRAEACPGGHMGPPLRGGGGVPKPTEIGAENGGCPMGWDGARPLQGAGQAGGGVRLGCGGVWSPRPAGAAQVVCSSGPMYLRNGFRRPNFVPKFGASVMVIGPYALRGDERAARRGRRALRVVAESRRDCPGQRRTAECLRRGREGWVGIGAEIIPEGASNAGQSLSHGLRP